MRKFFAIVACVLAFYSNATTALGQLQTPVLNYEFRDGLVDALETSFRDNFLFSLPGGTYWNRVSSAFYDPNVPPYGWFDPAAARDQFGNVPLGIGNKVVPRAPIANRGSLQVDGSTVTPPLGSVTFTSLSLAPLERLMFVELVGAQFGREYDIAMYFEVENPFTQLLPEFVKLSGVVPNTGNFPTGEQEVVFAGGRIYLGTVFRNVVGVDMHIGSPGEDPQGWGVSSLPNFFTQGGSPAVQIAGVQIRASVPEPASLPLACVGAGVVLLRRCRTRRRSRQSPCGRQFSGDGDAVIVTAGPQAKNVRI